VKVKAKGKVDAHPPSKERAGARPATKRKKKKKKFRPSAAVKRNVIVQDAGKLFPRAVPRQKKKREEKTVVVCPGGVLSGESGIQSKKKEGV